ncbi:unnamed protein product [Calypogeia fissa]
MVVGGSASSLLQRLAVSTATPSSTSSYCCTSTLLRTSCSTTSTASSLFCSNSNSSSSSASWVLAQWRRNLSVGSLSGSSTTIGRSNSSFFGGDFSSMAGGIAPEVLGKSPKGGGGNGGGAGGARMMGGGPRTFPGGVSKWQWKRMQEKKERQIEKARLLRERQAYEERRRQELLAASPRMEKPWDERILKNPLAPPNAALDPQVRALADRFRKNDGEDLWTEADGPVSAADGLPSLASARFRPDRTSSAGIRNGEVKINRREGRPARSFVDGGASQEEDGMGRFRGGGASTAVADPERTFEGPRGNAASRRVLNDGVPMTGRGSSVLRGKLDNLSISRNFSSTSAASGGALLEDIYDERGVSRDRNARGGGDGGSGSGRLVAEKGLDRSGSGKRFAESGYVDSPSVADPVQQRKKARQTPSPTEDGEASTPSHLSESRFDAFPISKLSIRALHEVMGYERMTNVQEATFPLILQGKDVLAKAKTGTGKTIAFLLPSIEAILKAGSERTAGLVGRSPINVLIICPTRELASQAATEAKTLMTYHKGMGAHIVIGGTNIKSEATNLEKRPCQVLVATPGRLLDHMTTSREIRQQLNQLKVLVLDEADRLLDMGFRKDLEKIIKMLPQSRQTLLFSATVPNEVHKVSEVALRRDHVFVDTVGQDTEDTHAKVQQQYTLVPLEKQLGAVYTILEDHIKEEPKYKVLVFCTTARSTALMAELSTKLGLNTLEIHSRKSQGYRTRVSDTFRNSEGGVIMFTSDVSARGVDYPDVTLVIQLGIPAGREEYVHRLGRTGRAGKEGQGVLILAPWEQQFLRALKDIPITEYKDLTVSDKAEKKVNAALAVVSTDTKEKAYQAWLGYYNSAKMLSLNKTELVRLANFFSSTLGMDEPPILMKKTIGMMGLRGVPGLRAQ